MKQVVVPVIFGTLIIASLLMRLADLLDVHCDSDDDCSRPRVCRFVCRRNCKSVCVLLVAAASEKDFLAPAPAPVPPNRQLAAPKRNKMWHRKPTDGRSAEEEAAPFLAGNNPFALAKLKEVTALTLSEAQLEAELRQNGPREEENEEEDDEAPKGPPDFVTAPMPATFLEEATDTSAPQPTPSSTAPIETRGNNLRETMASKNAGTISQVRGRGRSPSPPHLMTLSTSMELLQGENDDNEKKTVATSKMLKLMTRTTTATAKTTINDEREPPGVSPQPPGFTPMLTTSSSSTTTTTAQLSFPAAETTAESVDDGTMAEELANNGQPSDADRTQQATMTTITDRKKLAREHYSEEIVETKKSKKGGGGDFLGGKTKFWPPLKLAKLSVPPSPTAAKTTSAEREGTTTSGTATTTPRTTKRFCPAPPVCQRNCGIFIDEDGCQSCQCLWISKACDSDLDCAFTEGQFCDLGRCECADGWEQHIGMSGICRKRQSAKLRGVPNAHAQADQQITTDQNNYYGVDPSATYADVDQFAAFALSTYATPPFADADILSPSILRTNSVAQSLPPLKNFSLPFHHRLYVPNLGPPKRREKRQMFDAAQSTTADEQQLPSAATVLCDESDGQCPTNVSQSKMVPTNFPRPIVPINQPKQMPMPSLLFPHFNDDITASENHFSVDETPVDYDDEDGQMGDTVGNNNGTIIAPPKQMPSVASAQARPTTALIQTVHTLHFYSDETPPASQTAQGEDEKQHTISAVAPNTDGNDELTNAQIEETTTTEHLLSAKSEGDQKQQPPAETTTTDEQQAQQFEQQQQPPAETTATDEQQFEHQQLPAVETTTTDTEQPLAETTTNDEQQSQQFEHQQQPTAGDDQKTTEIGEASTTLATITSEQLDDTLPQPNSPTATKQQRIQHHHHQAVQLTVEALQANATTPATTTTTTVVAQIVHDWRPSATQPVQQQQEQGVQPQRLSTTVATRALQQAQQHPLAATSLQQHPQSPRQHVQAVHAPPSATPPPVQAVVVDQQPQAEAMQTPADQRILQLPSTASQPQAVHAPPSSTPPPQLQAVHPPSATPPPQLQAVHPPSATPPAVQAARYTSPPFRAKAKSLRALKPFSLPQQQQQQRGLKKIPYREAAVHSALRGTDLRRHHPLRHALPWEEGIKRPTEAFIPPVAISPGKGPEAVAEVVGEPPALLTEEIGRGAEESDSAAGGEMHARIYLDYTRRNRISRPIRVEHKKSKELIKDECEQSRDCGRRQFLCCAKQWCDLSGECGMAKFCLPSCELTKLAHLSELSPEGIPRMDFVYD